MTKSRKIFLVAILCLPFVVAPSDLLGQTAQLTRTPWKMHEGEGIVKVPDPTKVHGDPSFYPYAQIPGENDKGWKDAPDGKVIGLDEASVLAEGVCFDQVNFTYFQTIVTVPPGVTVTEFSVQFDGMDDGSRITIWKPNTSEGQVVEGSYVRLGGSGTTNLASYVAEGKNRVVVTQLDDCCCHNRIKSAVVRLNGETVGVSPPTVTNTSWGDVHIRTPDGMVYDYQGTGDFLALVSADSQIVVHARQEPSATNPRVSLNTAVALSVSGDKVGFYMKPSPGLEVNSQPVQLPSGTLPLPQGGRIERSGEDSRPKYVVRWPNGFVFGVVLHGSTHLDYGVSKPPGLKIGFDGLVGNLDGSSQNDFHVRNGETISLANGKIGLADLNRFAESWRLSATDTPLLRAPSGGAIPANPSRPLAAADLPHLAKAQQACQGITDTTVLNNCLTDVAATGDPTFAESAQQVQVELASAPSPVPFVSGSSDTPTTLSTLIGQWIFEGPSGSLKERTGRWGEVQLVGSAKLDAEGLHLSESGWARADKYQGSEIAEKTLIAWFKMGDLGNGSPAGGPLALDAIDQDNFDAIGFGERAANTWMAGSSFFARTNAPPQAGNPKTTEAGEILKIAITYKPTASGTVMISIYKNDVLATSYEQGPLAKWTAGNAEVLFGPRHTLGSETRGFLNATIRAAEIHNVALSADQLKERG